MEESSITVLPFKSALHYWLQLSQEPNHDFIRLLDYLSERDLGLLEIAVSEKKNKHLLMSPFKRYYETHEVSIDMIKCRKSYLDWILNRGLNHHTRKLAISLSFNESKDCKFDSCNIRFPHLLEITCLYMTPKLCLMLDLYSPNLHTLKILEGAYDLEAKYFESILSGCRKLSHIQISKDLIDPPTETFVLIAKYCKELQVLKLTKCDTIKSNSIFPLSKLISLEVLEIDLLFSWSNPLDAVFASNSKLTTVSFGGEFSHDPIMRALSVHCPLLKHIRLGAWAFQVLTDESIIAMVKGCPLLETIDISSWRTVSYFSYEGDGITRTLSVTNDAMYAITQYCPYLQVFSISSRDLLAYDNTGLDAIRDGCPCIKAIYKNRKVYYAVPGYKTTDLVYDAFHDFL